MGACQSDVNTSDYKELLPSNDEYKTKVPNEWDVSDVHNWLISTGLHSVATIFTNNNINGQMMLSINDQYLTQIGVSIHYKHRFEALRNSLLPNKQHNKYTPPPSTALMHGNPSSSPSDSNTTDTLNNISITIPQQRASYNSLTKPSDGDTTSISLSSDASPSTPYRCTPHKPLISVNITNTKTNASDASSIMPPLHECIQTPPVSLQHLDKMRLTNSARYDHGFLNWSDTDTKLEEYGLFEIFRKKSVYTQSGIPSPGYIQSAMPTPKNAIISCSTGSNNSHNQQKSNYNSSNSSDHDKSQNHDDNNNDNTDNNGNNGNNGGSAGDDGNNGDKEKNNKSNTNNNNDNDDEDKEEDEYEEDEKKDLNDDKLNGFYLNKNAPPFIPNPTSLPTIDEKAESWRNNLQISIDHSISASKSNDGSPTNKNSKKRKRNKPKKKSKDPFSSIRAKGNVQISRALTNKIIPQKVRENIKNLYLYMDRTTILHCNEEYNDDKIRIFNYDFHDKETGSTLYCIAERQDASKNRGFCWKMTNNLWTADEIETIYGIKQNLLPKSVRDSKRYIEEMGYIENIRENVKAEEWKTMINETRWTNLDIFGTPNNRQRLTLSMTVEQFVMNMIEKENMNNDKDMIPILVLNNKGYNIEYIKIIQIWMINEEEKAEQIIIDGNCIDIGISFRYNEQQKIIATAIYLNKQDIINMHQLALPNHECICQCLNDFRWNIINILHIGNPDDTLNKLKAAKVQIEGLKIEIQTLRKGKNNDVEMKNDNNTPEIAYTKSNNPPITPLSLNNLNLSYSNPNTPFPNITPNRTPTTPSSINRTPTISHGLRVQQQVLSNNNYNENNLLEWIHIL